MKNLAKLLGAAVLLMVAFNVEAGWNPCTCQWLCGQSYDRCSSGCAIYPDLNDYRKCEDKCVMDSYYCDQACFCPEEI